MWFKHQGLLRRYGMPLAAVAAVAVALVAVGIASGAGTRGHATKAQQLKFIFVSPIAASANATWVSVYKGFVQGGKDLGVNVVFRGPQSANVSFSAAQALPLLQQAIAAKPDGIIIDDFAPASLNKLIKQAVASGIPVVLSNSGYGQVAATGALTFVGNDDTRTGMLGGQMMSKFSKHALLVTATDAIPFVKQRNDGFDKGFKGKITRLTIPLGDLSDATAMRNLVSIALGKDKSIDGAFSIGSAISPSMITAAQGLGSRSATVHLAGIDLTTPVINALIATKYEFALDQQAYQEGYLPVQMLAQYIRYDLAPTVALTPTGPTVVTSQNAAKVAALVKQGIR
jgi:simple sugar transport system substrate-binding protein